MSERKGISEHDSIVYGRPPLFKVFISSEMRSHKLQPFRQIAAETIVATKLAVPWWWEGSTVTSPYSSESICLGHARTSDALVLIIGDVVTPIVIKEYEAAAEEGVEVLAFIQAIENRDEEVKQFIWRVRNGGNTTTEFSSREQLQEQVFSSLIQFLVRSARENSVTRRHRRLEQDFPPELNKAPSDIQDFSPDFNPFADQTPEIDSPQSPKIEQDFLETVRTEIDQNVSAKHFQGATDVVLWACEIAGGIGYQLLVPQFLKMLWGAVPSSAITETDRAWLLNVEGLHLGYTGKYEEAIAKFDIMKEIGLKLHDLNITSTALQNIAAEFQMLGRFGEARLATREAMSAKATLHDYHGFGQLVVNAASLAEMEGDAEKASTLLDESEEMIRLIGDPHLLSSFHGNLGRVAVQRGEFAKAGLHFRCSLKFARKSDDLRAVANALLSMGSVHMDLGRPKLAVRWYRKGIQAAELIDDQGILQLLYQGMSMAEHALGNTSGAVDFLEKSIHAAELFGNHSLWAKNMARLGAMQLLEGQYNASVESSNIALEVFQRLGDEESQADVHFNLASAMGKLGNPNGSARHIDIALKLIPPTDNERFVSALELIGRVWAEAGDARKARDRFRIAYIEATERMDGRFSHGLALRAARLLEGLRCYQDSEVFYSDSIEQAKIGEDEYAAREGRGLLRASRGDNDGALFDFDRCAEIVAANDMGPMFVTSLSNASEVCRRMDDSAGAVERSLKALGVARNSGDPNELRITLLDAGKSYTQSGAFEDSANCLTEALELSKKAHESKDRALIHSALGSLFFDQNDFREMREHFRHAVLLDSRNQDESQLCSDLSGLVIAKVLSGEMRGFNSRLQSFIDLCQRIDRYSILSQTLSAIARSFREKGDVSSAVTALANGLVADVYSAHQLGEEAVLWSFLELVATVGETRKTDLSTRDAVLTKFSQIVAHDKNITGFANTLTRSMIRARRKSLGLSPGK